MAPSGRCSVPYPVMNAWRRVAPHRGMPTPLVTKRFRPERVPHTVFAISSFGTKSIAPDIRIQFVTREDSHVPQSVSTLAGCRPGPSSASCGFSAQPLFAITCISQWKQASNAVLQRGTVRMDTRSKSRLRRSERNRHIHTFTPISDSAKRPETVRASFEVKHNPGISSRPTAHRYGCNFPTITELDGNWPPGRCIADETTSPRMPQNAVESYRLNQHSPFVFTVLTC